MKKGSEIISREVAVKELNDWYDELQVPEDMRLDVDLDEYEDDSVEGLDDDDDYLSLISGFRRTKNEARRQPEPLAFSKIESKIQHKAPLATRKLHRLSALLRLCSTMLSAFGRFSRATATAATGARYRSLVPVASLSASASAPSAPT